MPKKAQAKENPSEAKQYARELHKSAPRVFVRRSAQADEPNDLWSADLMDVSNTKQFNKGITFLLVVIDVYSRYAWVIPLKNKAAQTVTTAFESITDLPSNLWVDQGKEFYNRPMTIWCNRFGINRYSTFSGMKAVHAERFIRTLRDKLFFLATESGSQEFLTELPNIVRKYNRTRHTAIRQKPEEVFEGSAEPFIRENPIEEDDDPEYQAKFRIGDKVRYSLVKGIFAKGGAEKWSREVCQVESIDTNQRPYMYRIQDRKGEVIRGMFYEQELQKTQVPHWDDP